MKNVGLYANYFMFDTIKRYYICGLQIIYKNNIKSIPDKNRWWNCIHVHFIVKFVTGFVISCALIRGNHLNSDERVFQFVAMGSVCCYFLQFPLLIAIRIWGLAITLACLPHGVLHPNLSA